MVVYRKRLSLLLESRGDKGFVTNLNGFLDAVSVTMDQLRLLQERLSQRLHESAALIFEAHFMILKDPRFLGAMKDRIKDGQAPVKAVRSVIRYYIDRFSSSESVKPGQVLWAA